MEAATFPNVRRICPRQESNLHDHGGHKHLKLACLPFHHAGRTAVLALRYHHRAVSSRGRLDAAKSSFTRGGGRRTVPRELKREWDSNPQETEGQSLPSLPFLYPSV